MALRYPARPRRVGLRVEKLKTSGGCSSLAVDPTLSGSTILGAEGASAGGLNQFEEDSDDEFEPSV